MTRRGHRRTKDQLFAQFARVGTALSSPKRLELLDLLAQAERPVDAIAEQTGLSIGNTSAHLKVLHAARLVDRRREGQRVFYRLADARVVRVLRELQALARTQLVEADQLVQRFYEAPDDFEPVSPAELKRRIEEGDVLVLDVRPPEEFAAGHLPGARNLPPGELGRRLGELPGAKEIVAYCRGPYCLYSVEAVVALRRRGFRARRLAGGLPDWRARGYPVLGELT